MKDPKNPKKQYGFEEDYLKGKFPHSEPMICNDEEWAIVYTNRDYNACNDFIAGLR